jgi:hypothetical protein
MTSVFADRARPPLPPPPVAHSPFLTEGDALAPSGAQPRPDAKENKKQISRVSTVVCLLYESRDREDICPMA